MKLTYEHSWRAELESAFHPTAQPDPYSQFLYLEQRNRTENQQEQVEKMVPVVQLGVVHQELQGAEFEDC